MSAVGLWALSPVGRWHYVVAGDLGPVAACGRWHVEATPETAEQRPDGACLQCRVVTSPTGGVNGADDALKAELRRACGRMLAQGFTVAEVARYFDVGEQWLRRLWNRPSAGVRAAEVSS